MQRTQSSARLDASNHVWSDRSLGHECSRNCSSGRSSRLRHPRSRIGSSVESLSESVYITSGVVTRVPLWLNRRNVGANDLSPSASFPVYNLHGEVVEGTPIAYTCGRIQVGHIDRKDTLGTNKHLGVSVGPCMIVPVPVPRSKIF